jgi:RNA methyltransferase, TrmH family
MLSKTQAKYIQSLFHKKFREEFGQFVIEGPKMLSEAINSHPADISRVYMLWDWALQNPDLTKKLASEIIYVNEDEMGKISFLSNPSQVLAIMAKPQSRQASSFPGITVLLDGIQDPGNMGTIIRTADWFGVENIICGDGSVDCYNPKVIQSTMGSIFRMNIIYQNLYSFLTKWPAVPVLISSLDGKPLDEVRKQDHAFLVVGNESRGVSDEIINKATVKIRIEGHGSSESLNAAVATGILLYWITGKE